MKINNKTIGVILLVIFLILAGYFYIYKKQPITTNQEAPKATIETTSSLQVEPKTTPSDPDLIVTQKYIAKVNGEKIEAPLKTTSKNDSTATLTQEIDLTPVLNKLKPKDAIGVGLGVHEGDVYVPVGYLHNYKGNKAIEVTIHLDPQEQMKPNGAEVMHWWYTK